MQASALSHDLSPECSLEGLELKLQYLGHLMRRVNSLDSLLDAGRDWGQGEKGTTEDEMAGDEMASPTRCTQVWVNFGSW